MKKKVLATVLACGLLTSSFAFSTGATAETTDVVETGKTVTFMVTVDSPALIDYVISSGGAYGDVGELLSSASASSCLQQIKGSQEKVKSLVASEIKNSDLTDSKSFTAVTNGFTVKADVAYFETIKALEGVADVSISNEYDKSEIMEEYGEEEEYKMTGSYGMTSKSTVNAQGAYDEGYTGKGTLIAIVDSEFNVEHEAFSVAPEVQKYDKDYVTGINNAVGLNIDDAYSINDVFYNGKIIYAYDYGENDNDCADPDAYHGTHVTGIAAGNNGEDGDFQFKGMAYDAQLALFKISDSYGGLSDDAIVAALDDAIKLSPDVINCSYGATRYLVYDREGKQLYEKLTQAGVSIAAAAGNSAYDTYDAGISEITADHVNYYTIGQPSSMKDVFSVASVIPDAVYNNEIYFVFNSEERASMENYPLNISYDQISSHYSSVSSAPDSPAFSSPVTEEDDDYIMEAEFNYTYIDSYGEDIDFSKLDMTGQVLIFNQGKEPIGNYILDAYDTNCDEILIVKNDEYFQPTNLMQSFVSVSLLDSSVKEYLAEHTEGIVSARMSAAMRTINKSAARMVDEYSSYGTVADLTLKPDIAAPGSDILSAGYDGYESMSGTSMATPCTTGAIAIMKQYVRENGYSDLLSPYNEEEYIYKLMMSTAEIAAYPYDVYGTGDMICFSPRLQGAGIIDLDAAIKTGAYLSVDGARPKASLKDNVNGTYNFDFTITNRSENDITYMMDALIYTDGSELRTAADGSSYYANTLVPESIKDYADITFSTGGAVVDSVTVAAGADLVVSVSIQLDESYVNNHKTIFTNGFYVDGYVTLGAVNDVNLNMPFSGFCGDWSDEAIFSNDIYTSTGDGVYDSSSLVIGTTTDTGEIFALAAGETGYGCDELPREISFSKDTFRNLIGDDTDFYGVPYNSILLPNFYLYREALDFTIGLKKGDDMLYYQNYGDVASYFNMYLQPYYNFLDEYKEPLLLDYMDAVEDLEEGEYEYVISAATVGTDGNPGRTETRSYNVKIDNTKPVIDSYYVELTDDGRKLLHFYATDNNLIQGSDVYAVIRNEDGEVTDIISVLNDYAFAYGELSSLMTYSYDESTGLYEFTYDIASYEDFIKTLAEGVTIEEEDGSVLEIGPDERFAGADTSSIGFEAIDFAYNMSETGYADVNAYGEATLTFVDEKGAPVEGLNAVIGDTTYTTDSKGVIIVKGLALDKTEVKLDSDSYVLASGDEAYTFELTEDKYKFEGTVKVKAVEKKTSEPEISKPESSTPEISKPEESSTPAKHTDVVDEPKQVSVPITVKEVSTTDVVTVKEQSQVSTVSTGDNSNGTVIPVVMMAIGSTVLVLALGRKRKRS